MSQLWPYEVDHRIESMMRALSGPSKKWVTRCELVKAVLGDRAIARDVEVHSTLTGAPPEEIAGRIVDDWARTVAEHSGQAGPYIETSDGLEPAWRCEPRPLPPLDETLQRIVDELIGRGAILDGEAGGRTMLMWDDRPTFVGRVNEESVWAAAQVSMIAGLDLEDDEAVEDVLAEFATSAVRPMFEFSTTEGTGIVVWIDRIIGEHEIVGAPLAAAIDQLQALAIELGARLAEIESPHAPREGGKPKPLRGGRRLLPGELSGAGDAIWQCSGCQWIGPGREAENEYEDYFVKCECPACGSCIYLCAF